MKKSEIKVISISLAEVVLLLFFLVLLALAAREKNHENQIDQMRNEQQRMMAEMEMWKREIKEFLAIMPVEPRRDSADTVLVSLSRLYFVPSPARDNLKDMAEKIRAYRKMMAGLQQIAMRQGESIPELMTALNNMKQDRNGCQAKIHKLEQKVADLLHIIENSGNNAQACALENRDLKNINRELAEKVEKCSNGEGFPPCWRSADGDIQYMYDIYIGHNGLSVHRAWPAKREVEMQSFARAEMIVDRTVDIKDFLAATRDIFSRSEEKQCRHFVRIYGEKSAMNARMFTYYQEIQNHFYHLDAIR